MILKKGMIVLFPPHQGWDIHSLENSFGLVLGETENTFDTNVEVFALQAQEWTTIFLEKTRYGCYKQISVL